MALPRCPRNDCNGRTFEACELAPINSRFRLMSIQCAKCGAVVGVQELHNVNYQLGQIAERLGVRL